jgi:hypothetical protein
MHFFLGLTMRKSGVVVGGVACVVKGVVLVV